MNKTIQINLRVSADFAALLDTTAREEGLTRSELIRRSVLDYIAKNEAIEEYIYTMAAESAAERI